MGADHVIDYRREDFTRGGRTYDLVLDLAAYRPVSAYRRCLAPGGRYLFVGGSVSTLFGILLQGPLAREGKRVRVLVAQLGAKHLSPIIELCQEGKISIVIDRRFRLDEVPEALLYLGEGHAKGKVVVQVV
jgi:NADPH:quinone reductase-like Zn-dependent oxidoreductase